MNQLINCDLAIIGAGAGGLSLASGAAQLGLNVILIEKGAMGGDCLNYGCIPSKSLLAAAKNCWSALHSKQLGLQINQYQLNFQDVMAHVNRVINNIAVHDSVERFESLGVTIIKEQGRFIQKDMMNAGGRLIKAKYFVIATGSMPMIPPIPGISNVLYFTNETIFKLSELPTHLLVVGGGPIGCELAQAFAMLGSEVTLIEGESILNHDDKDCVAVIRDALIDKGIKLLEKATVTEVNQSQQGKIQLQVMHNNLLQSFEGTHLLVATGRIPNVDNLGCENANVHYDKKGIHVNDKLRTTNSQIFAIGDVIGGLQFTHVANDHASIVLRQIAFKIPSKRKENAVPWVTYTLPELAHVGSNEHDVKQLGISATTLKLDFEQNDRAQTEHKTKGLIKIVVNKKGAILGVSIVGEHAGELIYPWVVAIREGKTLRTFTDTIVPYPTFNYLSKRIAGQFYAPKLFSNPVKKIVRFLSYF